MVWGPQGMKGCSMETERPSDKNLKMNSPTGTEILSNAAKPGLPVEVHRHPLTSPRSASGNHRVMFAKLSKVPMMAAQLEASLASRRASKSRLEWLYSKKIANSGIIANSIANPRTLAKSNSKARPQPALCTRVELLRS